MDSFYTSSIKIKLDRAKKAAESCKESVEKLESSIDHFYETDSVKLKSASKI